MSEEEVNMSKHKLIINPKISGIRNYCEKCKTEQPYTGLYPYKKAFDDWMEAGCSVPDEKGKI